MPRILVVSLLVIVAFGWPGLTAGADEWRQLKQGMELRTLKLQEQSPVVHPQIVIVRFDPLRWQLFFVGLSNTGEAGGLTAREWCKRYQLTAAINAGMFNSDYKTHTGFLRSHNHTNSSTINRYKSVAAFDPRRPGETSYFQIFDLDVDQMSIEAILRDYKTVVQNLRLIKHPGENRWNQQKKMWSEAALGQDKEGRVLFIFSRWPLTMHDLNRELLSAGIGIVAAQHLEGGPEAQLYLKAGSEEINLFGSYEIDFRENDANGTAWPVPNVLGIRPRR